MRCVIVSHTHWDREWYRTFQAFRARLVDTVDRILDLIAVDPDYHFQLDGQTIVIEDYLEIRPQRREALEAACRAGRIAIGPWYVQPDSLLPSGEAHVRNLLEGRRVAEQTAHASRIAYTPDSFGHPAQFPQLFAGFGLDPFIFWRGNANELDALPTEYRWRSPDGSEIRACHLPKGYFGAWGLGDDVPAATARLEQLARDLAEGATSSTVLLMNGIDHMLPDAHIREIAESLHKSTGWEVQRGLLDDYAADLSALEAEFEGELLGGRAANLLPGVWSTRVDLKLRNRACESLLEGWAEPWAALGQRLGGPDERAALRTAWRSLLPNQAHDSICGCSQDRVHAQMHTRYDDAEGLTVETTTRVLEQLAGLGVERQIPDGPLEIGVFNPSPHTRSDVVRLPLEGYPAFTSRGINRLLAANLDMEGFEVDGQPARIIRHAEHRRPNLSVDQPVHDLEFVAQDVPAFGWRKLELTRSEPAAEEEDEGREIEAGGIAVRAEPQGTLALRIGGREWTGLCGLEDLGDRGDTYDFDPVSGPAPEMEVVRIRRHRYPNGMQRLTVHRRLHVPERLAADRATRCETPGTIEVHVEARVAPGVERVDLTLRVVNGAEDHRLRVLFPSGRPCETFRAATTFDTAVRSPGPQDDEGWIHPAPSTFPHQGWVSANDLMVVAPGLPEAEVLPDGSIAITLLRAVGWLSRPDLTTRQGEAGPALPTPAAQCPGSHEMKIHLLAGCDPAGARDAELGLRAVAAGDAPLLGPDVAMLSLTPRDILLSALKPAEDGDGIIVRVANPTDEPHTARVDLGFAEWEAAPARLDEEPLGPPLERRGSGVELELPAHALRTLRIR